MSASAQTPSPLPAPEPTRFNNNPVCFATIRSVERKLNIDEPGLRAKVAFMTSIQTLEEETMVRSLHPALKHCDCVSVVEGGPVRKPLWLVHARGARNIYNTRRWQGNTCPAGTNSSTRYTLGSVDASCSIGAQILFTGWLLILFPEKKSLEACWDKGVPDEVGGLRVGYIIASFHATANIVESGRAVSSAPGILAQQAALGLRVRLPGGQEAITTVTHAFVRLADSRMSKIRKRFTEYILTAKDYLKRMTPPPRQTPQAAIVHPKQVANSPVGKQIGTITVTYDRCTHHRMIPYPYGFQHDLSLVTGPNLPQLTNPPNTPRVTEWGPYEAALQGRPVFVHRYNIATGSLFTYQGHGVTTQAQQCIIHGTQYSWDARAFGTALLWRTLRDTDSVQGTSSSVLCLGEPQHKTARALLFQNFEAPLTASESVHIDENEEGPVFKGGFLLPEEIRRSHIITVGEIYPEDFRTPQKSSSSEVPTQEYGMTV
ncbi:hypothetical protein CBS147326_2026 [Penicillium roqueforti]|nr:hypothetical protein CBS147326_2026 [Penicillium roqueforti]